MFAGHSEDNNMADNNIRLVWTEDEIVSFLRLIKEKNITTILDSKQQRNATIYQELRAEMLSWGFDKLWTAFCNKWKSLKQMYVGEKRALEIFNS